MPEFVAITPETKVGALLAAYPALEEPLIALSPSFSKLRNPVLRRTVASIATLRQVAAVGDVPVAALINRLREAAGITEVYEERAAGDAAAPSWTHDARIALRYDARADLEAGVHPAQRVLQELQQLGPGDAYELVTPFVPSPLIDLARGKGFEAWSVKEGADCTRTLFHRA
jgi:hypothetical protein